MPCTITIKDRNCSAYLMTQGFTPAFVPRPDGTTVDAEFEWSEELDRAKTDYISNLSIGIEK